MGDGRLPPSDTGAEESVLGALLIDEDAIFMVTSILKPEDFFSQANRWVYEACMTLFERHEGINQITVARELAQRGKLEEVGGAAYLSHLVANVPNSLHIEYYAQIVVRLATMRRLIGAADRIAAIGYEAEADVEAALSRAEDQLFKVRERRGHGEFLSISNILGDYFKETEPVTDESQSPFIMTGLSFLDDLVMGLQRSALVVLGARTSMGKTSLALTIARNAAIEQKACVAVFSLEMSAQEIGQRLLSSESGVNSAKIRRAHFSEGDEQAVMDAAAVLSEAPLFIDDTAQMRVVEMRSKARRLDFEHPLDLIIVDYLQLIRGDTRTENRYQELSEITRSLKFLARDLNVPVLALSQLRRPDHSGPVRKPGLSDLRDSGSIEQDADVVMFLHREERERSLEPWSDVQADEAFEKGITEIIIAKNRNGPIGDGKLRFDAKTTRFFNLDTETSQSVQIQFGK